MKELIFLFVVLNGGEPVEHKEPFDSVPECMEEAYVMQDLWINSPDYKLGDSFAGLCLRDEHAVKFRDNRELPAIIPEHRS